MPNVDYLTHSLVASLAGESNRAPSDYGDALALEVNGHLDRHPEDAESIARELVECLREGANRIYENRRETASRALADRLQQAAELQPS